MSETVVESAAEHWRIPLVSVEVLVERVVWLLAMLLDETNHAQPRCDLCEGAHPFSVAFHLDVYLFEGVTGTEEELYEALRKNCFSVALRGSF